MSVKLTVITVCYNAAKLLPVTVESVLAQDCTDMEYVIVDGGSDDDTAKVVDSYKEAFNKKNIGFRFISEKDNGIYDAMNKGVRHAEGSYVNFMNAGDCFYDGSVLKSVENVIDNAATPPGIIYGGCAVFEYGRFYKYARSVDIIKTSMPFSHQSVFASRTLLSSHPFNTGYRYSADYDFLLTAYDLKEIFTDCGHMVCIVTADGLSSVRYRDTLIESADIQKAHGVYSLAPDKEKKMSRTLLVKQFVLDRFPVFVKKAIRGMQIRSRGQEFSGPIPEWFKKAYLTNP